MVRSTRWRVSSATVCRKIDLGFPVVVLNKPGASMIVATEFAAKSKPDGYTLLIGNTNLALNPVVQASLPYDTLKDLQPVSMLPKAANIVVVLPTSPLNTLGDPIDKSKPNGATLKYTSYGIGAPTHLAVEILRKKRRATCSEEAGTAVDTGS